MTNSPPPDPRSSGTPLGFDEFLAVVLALGAIGGILLWSLSRQGRGFQIPNILPLALNRENPCALPTGERQDESRTRT